MMARPLDQISVVLPVYNEAATIERVLRDLDAKVVSSANMLSSAGLAHTMRPWRSTATANTRRLARPARAAAAISDCMALSLIESAPIG